MHPTSLAIQLAARLEADIQSADTASLPPLRELCTRYAVSRPTLSAALHLLADRGVVQMYPKKRVTVAARMSPGSVEPREPGGETLLGELARAISDGEVVWGTPLPKIAYQSARLNVSNKTVAKVYRALVAQGLAHRKGRQVIAGPAPSVQFRSDAPGVMLVLSGTSHQWEGMCTSQRTQLFCQAFLHEKEQAGIRLIKAVDDDTSPPQRNTITGRESILAHVHQLGPRYLGTLVVGTSSQVPELASWLELLCGRGRPVVWFDHSDDRSAPACAHRAFFRCRYSEDRVVAPALEFLLRLGHTRLAYVHDNTIPWMVERERALRGWIDRYGAPVILTTTREHTRDEWERPESGAVLDGLERLRSFERFGAPRALSFFEERNEHYRRACAQFIPEAVLQSPFAGVFAVTLGSHRTGIVLSDEEVAARDVVWACLPLQGAFEASATVVIGPNDVWTRGRPMNWFDNLKLRTPDDIGVVSFDNAHRYSFYPLTSVDIGFQSLGFRAFHALMGDVQVNADRQRNVWIAPFVVDNGSVAPSPATTLNPGDARSRSARSPYRPGQGQP